MERKEQKPAIRPATVCAAGVLFNVLGGGLIAGAVMQYRANVHSAAVLTDTAATVYRIDVECAGEGTP